MQVLRPDAGVGHAVRMDSVRIVRGDAVILDDTSFELPLGSITAVLGPAAPASRP